MLVSFLGGRSLVTPDFQQVVHQAHEFPLTAHLVQAPQQELAEAPRLFYLAKHRLHDVLPFGVPRTA